MQGEADSGAGPPSGSVQEPRHRLLPKASSTAVATVVRPGGQPPLHKVLILYTRATKLSTFRKRPDELLPLKTESAVQLSHAGHNLVSTQP